MYIHMHPYLIANKIFNKKRIMQIKAIKNSILVCSVSLMHTSKVRVLEQLLHAQTRMLVFLGLTLFFCGPVLNPGFLTKYIPISEESKVKNTLDLRVDSYLFIDNSSIL